MTWRPNHPFFAHVHPLFWPVLWWNLHRFVARLEALMDLHGPDGRISWRVSWYGVIEICALYREPWPTWRNLVADCRAAVACACAGPVGMVERICGRLRRVLADRSRKGQIVVSALCPPAILDSS